MARNPRYDVLFEPVKIGPVTARNRFYAVPHAAGMTNIMPHMRATFRGIKAEGGWGVVCTGYVSIDPSSDDAPLPFATLWDEDDVSGEWDGRVLSHVRMLPRPRPRPQVLIGGYVDRVLRRVATRSDGWVTYFYTPESIAGAWDRVRGYAEDAGRDPEQLNLVAQVPLCIGDSYEEATRRAGEYVGDYFDVPAWSEATPESAVRGTPAQCAEQIAAYLEAGVKHLVFCPYNYELEQVQRLAIEVLPKLGTRVAD